MKYYSTNKISPAVSFEDAVVRGLAPDKGLYFPEKIGTLPKGLIGHNNSIHEIAFEVAKLFVDGEIDNQRLQTIVEETLAFTTPIVNVEKDVFSLELWHGPTCAFKDVGARFLARCLSYFVQRKERKVTILVATSGDTGSAVANGFLGVEGIDVVILYPKGKVSKIQEQQLTTIGHNIAALEVEGTFDDCQKMVKLAFNDESLTNAMNLSSANSINVARFLPQSFYYFSAYEQLEDKNKPVAFSVPSGNFGNLTAGMFASRMGLPVEKFIAATNVNDVIPEYLKTGVYRARPSIPTISNAMDIGDPSNFARILELHKGNLASIQNEMVGYSYTDEETAAGVKYIMDTTGYLSEPHGAIGYLALKEYMKTSNCQGIFLETAHPAKFGEVVEPILNAPVAIPERLQDYLSRKKEAVLIAPEYEALKSYLLNR
jgi:threonine synthase